MTCSRSVFNSDKCRHVTMRLQASGQVGLVTSMLHELIQRSALSNALSGRDEESLAPVLHFVTKHINNCRYSSILIDVATSLLGI